MQSIFYSRGPLKPDFLAQLHLLWMVLFLASAVNLSHLLHYARTLLELEAISVLLGTTFGVSGASRCDPCASCRVCLAPWGLQPAPCSPQTSLLLPSQPVSRRKCILVTFLFGWFLAPKPPAEAGRRHCVPLVGMLSRSHSSSSRLKEKSDSVGVVPVRVSPTVSNLCVGYTRRRCAVIFGDSVIWFPACCLPQQHSLGSGGPAQSPGLQGTEPSLHLHKFSLAWKQLYALNLRYLSR